jgi:hypothetical protein
MTHLVGSAVAGMIMLSIPTVAWDEAVPQHGGASPFEPPRIDPRRAPARPPAPGPERAKGTPDAPAEEERAPDPPSPLWPPPRPPDDSERSLA